MLRMIIILTIIIMKRMTDDYHFDDNDHEEDNPILERGRRDGGLRCLLKLIQITCGLFCF